MVKRVGDAHDSVEEDQPRPIPVSRSLVAT